MESSKAPETESRNGIGWRVGASFNGVIVNVPVAVFDQLQRRSRYKAHGVLSDEMSCALSATKDGTEPAEYFDSC